MNAGGSGGFETFTQFVHCGDDGFEMLALIVFGVDGKEVLEGVGSGFVESGREWDGVGH